MNPPDYARPLILVVDEDPRLSLRVHRLLRDDFRVTTVDDEEAALRYLDEHPTVAGVICRLDQYRINARRVWRHAPEATRPRFLFLLKQLGQPPEYQNFVRHVPNPVLQKPVSTVRFRLAVRGLMRRAAPV